MRPPRRVYMTGLNKRAQLSGVPIFKNWIKDKQQVVKEQPER